VRTRADVAGSGTRSPYPYSADGENAVPATADWLDPLLGLSFAAAVTNRIGLATGVLLPEHKSVLAAKQAATLDVLSGGGSHSAGAPAVRRLGARSPGTSGSFSVMRSLSWRVSGWSRTVPASPERQGTRFSGVRLTVRTGPACL
jgi:hypothetical protein